MAISEFVLDVLWGMAGAKAQVGASTGPCWQ